VILPQGRRAIVMLAAPRWAAASSRPPVGGIAIRARGGPAARPACRSRRWRCRAGRPRGCRTVEADTGASGVYPASSAAILLRSRRAIAMPAVPGPARWLPARRSPAPARLPHRDRRCPGAISSSPGPISDRVELEKSPSRGVPRASINREAAAGSRHQPGSRSHLLVRCSPIAPCHQDRRSVALRRSGLPGYRVQPTPGRSSVRSTCPECGHQDDQVGRRAPHRVENEIKVLQLVGV